MSRRLVSRAWAVAVLAGVLGILPATSRALPLHPSPAALRAEAGDWLSRLGRLFDSLWKKATAETGMSIDPDGRLEAQPGNGPSPDGDTGMSIDPNG
jgi:hypothetical protein